MILKSVPSRLDLRLACDLQNSSENNLARIRVAKGFTSQAIMRFLGGGFDASYRFEAVSSAGSPLLFVDRPFRLERKDRFELSDNKGRAVGALVQKDGRSDTRRTFFLQDTGGTIGYTQDADDSRHALAATNVTICDNGGRVVASISRTPAKSYFWGNDFFDYALKFEQPPHEPLGSLCVAAALAEYFYYRIGFGGALRAITALRW